jgi:hypothetical protein
MGPVACPSLVQGQHTGKGAYATAIVVWADIDLTNNTTAAFYRYDEYRLILAMHLPGSHRSTARFLPIGGNDWPWAESLRRMVH